MPLPDKARSHAVLIGAGDYRSAALPDLPSVANNLRALRAALTEPVHGSFAPDRCTVIENPVDQSRVAGQLADVAAAAEDVLLIYYTGHGLVGTRRQELFLGLSATDPARPQYSALPFSWIRDELLDSVAATKVLILDCCFSGLAVEGFLADQDALVQGQVSVRGTYTLAATPANMAALAPPGAEHTAFSGELLTLLRDGVPTGPPELDLHLIYQHLTQRMREEGWPTPKQYGTDNVLSLALARNPARTPSAPSALEPRLLVGVIGHAGHGKTALVSAIDAVPVDRRPVRYVDTGPDYAHAMISGSTRLDAAILVVAANDGPLPGTRAQLRLARDAGVRHVVVAVTKADLLDDEEFVELVEMEARELVLSHGYDRASVVRVSCPGVLAGEPRWVQAVRGMMAEFEALPAAEEPFVVAVEDGYIRPEGGTVVTGPVERGRPWRGAPAELFGVHEWPIPTVVDRVEKRADHVSLLLRDVPAELITRGQVVAATGTVTMSDRFAARVHHLAGEERGVHAAFSFHGVDVLGALAELADDDEDTDAVTVFLADPVAVAKGLRFVVRHDGRTVGFGLVTGVTT